MASRWAAMCPLVKLARTQTARSITLVYPYYENRRFLSDQIAGWFTYPEDLRAFLSAIVVDDGSPEPLHWAPPTPFPIRLFRIAVDVPWNWLAARNIGAHHAADGWILFSDMDHVMPVETLRTLIWADLNPRVVYAFSRREHTGQVVPPHSASFLMTRAMFWRIGGYDETLSGHYGTDGDFRRRVWATAPIHVLTDELIRHEQVGDASTTRYLRKLPADTAAVQRLVQARGKDWTPKTLSFPYDEVSC